MDVKNCKSCGRLFNYMSGPVMCPNCQRKLEEKFQQVKQYLDENPNSSVNQVAEAMDVSVKQIKQWIREERLALSQPSADGILCEHCGTPICSGRFCDKCKVMETKCVSYKIGIKSSRNCSEKYNIQMKFFNVMRNKKFIPHRYVKGDIRYEKKMESIMRRSAVYSDTDDRCTGTVCPKCTGRCDETGRSNRNNS